MSTYLYALDSAIVAAIVRAYETANNTTFIPTIFAANSSPFDAA